MPKYRVWFLGLALSLLVCFMAAPASAWEAKLVANYTNDYMYITQTGTQGFFGPYDVDLSGTMTGSSLNFWGGDFAQAAGVVSGSEVAWNGMWMTLDPDIHINKALRLRGRYYVGAWATPYAATSQGALAASEYFNYMSPGVQRSFSPGYWNLLWLTARLPWGIITVGKRPSTFGTGLAWNGEDNRSSESFSLTSDYGPFRIGWSTYLSREGNDDYYNRFADKNNKRYWDSAVTITYRSGALDMGALVNYVSRHRGPERAIVTPATKAAQRFRDRTDYYGGVYAKFNNGRFFANTEFDWYDRIDKENRATSYVFDYRAMGEVGVFSGPAKLSVLVSWHSGMDRRNGVTRGINQGCIQDPQNPSTATPNPRVLSASTSNTGVYRPYSYIMVYGYGLGNSINADTGEGYVQDAFCKAARLDYAVAANLNLFGTFFQANRVGNGYGWGYLKPAAMGGTNGVVIQPLVDSAGAVSGQYRGGTGAAAAPSIPDNDLGWEVDAGFDWNLLENFTVRTTWGYWQPGKWFSFACISKANPLWNVDSGAALGGALWGTQPDRTIDPVMAVNVQLLADF
jgi:hypothetical protein